MTASEGRQRGKVKKKRKKKDELKEERNVERLDYELIGRGNKGSGARGRERWKELLMDETGGMELE